MAIAAFNPLALARRLKDAGMDEPQAEAVADGLHEAVTENVATKADVAAVKADVVAVKVDVETVKADVVAIKVDVAAVKADVAAVKADVAAVEKTLRAEMGAVKWMVGLTLALMLAALARLFALI